MPSLVGPDHGDKREEGQNENLGVESRSKQQKTPVREQFGFYFLLFVTFFSLSVLFNCGVCMSFIYTCKILNLNAVDVA